MNNQINIDYSSDGVNVTPAQGFSKFCFLMDLSFAIFVSCLLRFQDERLSFTAVILMGKATFFSLEDILNTSFQLILEQCFI